MKLYTYFLATVCLLISGLSLNAQTEMEWDSYGVGFTVPDDFRITTNNAEEFSANNRNLYVTILPFLDETVTADDLVDVVAEFAKELQYDRIHEGDEIEIDDFTGYYIKGRKDGANAVLLALLDKESSTNLLVVIVYTDGNEDAAVEIAASFYAYD